MKIAIVQSGAPRVPEESLQYLDRQCDQLQREGHTVDVYGYFWQNEQKESETLGRASAPTSTDFDQTRYSRCVFASQEQLFQDAYMDTPKNRTMFGQLMGTIQAHRTVPNLLEYDIVLRQRFDLAWNISDEHLVSLTCTFKPLQNADVPQMFVSGLGLMPGRNHNKGWQAGDVLFWCTGATAHQAYCDFDPWEYTQQEIKPGVRDGGMHSRWVDYFIWRELHVESMFLSGIKPIRSYL